MWKMLCPTSLWYRDSNPRPLEHKSPPKTTRPEFQCEYYYLESEIFATFALGSQH